MQGVTLEDSSNGPYAASIADSDGVAGDDMPLSIVEAIRSLWDDAGFQA